jgi:flagellar biogenesis protein FliO
MFNHLTGFFVYMLAMMGLILIAFIVAKKAISLSTNKVKTGFLKLEGVLPLEPRKSIYLVKAGSERFLISSDLSDLKFLTKLSDDNIPPIIEENINEPIQEGQKLKEFPIDQLFNFNDPQNPLCNVLKNLINRK